MYLKTGRAKPRGHQRYPTVSHGFHLLLATEQTELNKTKFANTHFSLAKKHHQDTVGAFLYKTTPCNTYMCLCPRIRFLGKVQFSGDQSVFGWQMGSSVQQCLWCPCTITPVWCSLYSPVSWKALLIYQSKLVSHRVLWQTQHYILKFWKTFYNSFGAYSRSIVVVLDASTDVLQTRKSSMVLTGGAGES